MQLHQKPMLTVAFLLFCALYLSACGGDSPMEEPQQNPELDRLNEARLLWASFGIENYRLDIERTCFCVPDEDETTTVVNGDTITVVSSNQDVIADHWSELSVVTLFDQIEEAITDADSAVEVQYNEQFGYPEAIRFDWLVGAVDDEVSYQVALHSHYELRQTLAQMNTLWHEQERSAYEMDVTLDCFYCPGLRAGDEMTLTVADGQVTSGVYVADGEMVDLEALSSFPVTANALFAALDAYVEDGFALVTASFHENGHPKNVFIDPNLSIFDDQISIHTREIR